MNLVITILHHLTRVWDINGANSIQKIPISESDVAELKDAIVEGNISKMRFQDKIPQNYEYYIQFDGYDIFFILNGR